MNTASRGRICDQPRPAQLISDPHLVPLGGDLLPQHDHVVGRRAEILVDADQIEIGDLGAVLVHVDERGERIARAAARRRRSPASLRSPAPAAPSRPAPPRRLHRPNRVSRLAPRRVGRAARGSAAASRQRRGRAPAPSLGRGGAAPVVRLAQAIGARAQRGQLCLGGRGALASTASPPQPPTDVERRAARTRTDALRATGLSLRAGGLDVGADLELGLEQRAAGVAQRLGRAACWPAATERS